MIHSIDHIAVLIPARNEEELLPRCLESVLRAAEQVPPDVSVNIVVVVDASTDATLEVASALLGKQGQILVTDAGCVGTARSMAAQAAIASYEGLYRNCWLANTDADCVVPRSWLLDQLHLAQAGAHAIAGTIDVDDFSEHLPGVERLFRESYMFHPDGTHPHVHGANMGVRADVYLQVGGWSAKRTAEDHDLWNRISLRGFHKQAVAKLRVMTSGRRVGRAPLGFAGALSAHNEAAA